MITYGLAVGSADIVGILKRRIGDSTAGVFFALEVKQPGGKARANQLQWGGIVHFFSGFYAVVDSVDSAFAALNRARNGEKE